MPWDTKPEKSNTVYATVGAVACYKVKVSDEEDWEFTPCWVKGYAVQTGCLHWSPKDATLLVGFDDGSI